MLPPAHHLDAFNTEAYGLRETGRMLHLAGSTLSRWAKGWTAKGRPQEPMISAPDGRLSFQDLAELSVVAQLRACNLSVTEIRDAAAQIRSAKGVVRPLLHVLVSEDGREMFFEHLDRRPISTKKPGQAAISQVVRARLIEPERIVLVNGTAQRVYPYSREDHDSDPKLVAIDPRYRFGRPVTNPSMIDIDGLVLRVRWGESFEDIADYVHPQNGIPELEEGIRYWLSTMTQGMAKRLNDASPTVQARLAAFRAGQSVGEMVRASGVQIKTVERSLSKALEIALAA